MTEAQAGNAMRRQSRFNASASPFSLRGFACRPRQCRRGSRLRATAFRINLRQQPAAASRRAIEFARRCRRPAQPVLRSSSDLVRIDVEVTDRSGKPVKGLKADQFTITDDGQAQKISIFSYEDIEAVETASDTDTKPIVVAVDSPSDAAAQTAGEQARDRRMLVLFFDLTSLGTDDLIRAHDAAAKFVKQQMTKADLVSVVVFSSNLRVLSDFTNDHDKLNKAIAQLAARRVVPACQSALRRRAERRIRRAAGYRRRFHRRRNRIQRLQHGPEARSRRKPRQRARRDSRQESR